MWCEEQITSLSSPLRCDAGCGPLSRCNNLNTWNLKVYAIAGGAEYGEKLYDGLLSNSVAHGSPLVYVCQIVFLLKSSTKYLKSCSVRMVSWTALVSGHANGPRGPRSELFGQGFSIVCTFFKGLLLRLVCFQSLGNDVVHGPCVCLVRCSLVDCKIRLTGQITESVELINARFSALRWYFIVSGVYMHMDVYTKCIVLEKAD